MNIYIYIYIYIFFFFFGRFSSSWNEKKMRKKKHCSLLLGYCPFSACIRSRYNNLYRDIVVGKAGLGDTRGPRHGRACATIRPSEGMRYGRPARKGKRRAREGLAVGVLCRDTHGHIVTGTRLGRWVVSRYGHDTARGSAKTWRKKLQFAQQGGGGAMTWHL